MTETKHERAKRATITRDWAYPVQHGKRIPTQSQSDPLPQYDFIMSAVIPRINNSQNV